MSLKDDLVNETIVELEIKGWKYKPVTAGEENDWLPEYIYTEDGKIKTDAAKLNKCKMRNLVAAPYTKEEFKQFFSFDLDWKDMNHDQRWSVIRKLKPDVFNKIMKEINKIDQPSKKKD